MRTLVEIPKDNIIQLDLIAKEFHTSRSKLIRQAIETWLQEQATKQKIPKKDFFGILKEKNIPNSLEIQEKLRNDWI